MKGGDSCIDLQIDFSSDARQVEFEMYLPAARHGPPDSMHPAR